MPELPDVEQHRRRFDEHAAGRAVRGVAVPDRELLVGTSPQGLGRSLTGRRLAPALRHGKWLMLPTVDDGPQLLVHFRMTGELVFAGPATSRSDRDAVILELDGLEVRYRTVRRMGRVHWLAAGRDPAEVTGPLGPDALRLERGELRALLGGRRGGLKSALMDQELVAGLGNELVDDILWRARLHPAAPVGEVTDDQHAHLESAMREVLRRSVRAGHVPSGPTWINAQRETDHPSCPDCGTDLVRSTVAGRTTLHCPQHQPAP